MGYRQIGTQKVTTFVEKFLRHSRKRRIIQVVNFHLVSRLENLRKGRLFHMSLVHIENKPKTYICNSCSWNYLLLLFYILYIIDFELKKVLLPPLGNLADISYLKENFKPHLLRDVCTLCSGALVSDSLLHMLL